MSQLETIEFACPNCNSVLNVPLNLAGVTGPCPSCQASITAPSPIPAVSQAPPVYPSEPEPQMPPVPSAATIPTERPIGVAPHNQPISSPSQPTPARAAPVEMTPAQPTSPQARKIWPSILFPALFLLLAAAVVYLILDLMGILDFGKKSPIVQKTNTTTELPQKQSTTTPTPEFNPSTLPEPPMIEPEPAEISLPQPLEHDPQDLNKPGEISTELPDLSLKNTPENNASIKKRTTDIKEAQDVLKRFLLAQTFEERKPLITKSNRRSESDLAASVLAQPFPKSYEPKLEDVRGRPADRSFEVFFSVAFDQPRDARSKFILMRTITYSEEDAPKIHIDPFLDLYEGPIKKFYDEKTEGTQIFDSVVEFSAYCFDDIPRASAMAKVSFYTHITASAEPIATAYLNRESEAYKKLTDLGKPSTRIPATVNVAWDTETDPTKPFLQIVRIEDINWAL